MNVSLSRIGFCNLWTRESILIFYFACKQTFKLCISFSGSAPGAAAFSYIFFFFCRTLFKLKFHQIKWRIINFILIPFVPYAAQTLRMKQFYTMCK